MAIPLLLKLYEELPRGSANDRDLPWQRRCQTGFDEFRQKVLARYTVATVERLLTADLPQLRQAAVVALGLLGTMSSNRLLAKRLHDEDSTVRELAMQSMWWIWFQAGTPAQNEELRRLAELAVKPTLPNETAAVLDGFGDLIQQAPEFAEAYHQRGCFYYRLGDFSKSIKDCERSLKLNPHQFGAAGKAARCFVKQRKLRAALRAFRRSFKINPNLDGVRQAIESLEKALDEGGPR